MAQNAQKSRAYLRHARKAARQIRANRPGLRIAPTFSVPLTGTVAGYRGFMQERTPVQAAVKGALGSDRVLRHLSLETLARVRPLEIAECATENELHEIALLRGLRPQAQKNVNHALQAILERRGVPKLMEMLSGEGGQADPKKSAALQALIKLHSKRGPMGVQGLLETWAKTPEWLKPEPLNAIIAMGGRALPELERIGRESQNPHIQETIERLRYNIGHGEMVGEGKTEKKRHASRNPAKKKGKKDLLLRRNPAFAAPDLPRLLSTARHLGSFSGKLRQEFGPGFVGIILIGSASKGYFAKESDIDCVVVSDREEAAKRLKQLADDAKIGKTGPIWLNTTIVDKEPNTETAHFLFQGLFFGDRARLKKLQRIAFERLGKDGWENARDLMLRNETLLHQAFERLGITRPDEQRRAIAYATLRVAPPYEEMKKIMESARMKPLRAKSQQQN
ncbi:MAG: nucleotidyltransferase domain-containing protein [Candidatus Diapherotrites archaeon]